MTDSVSALIAQWIRDDVRAMHAYHVPDATGMIKLDAMENPFVLFGDNDAALREQWLEHLQMADLNRYPDPQAPAVKRALRDVLSIADSYDILLGNGSDEIIQLLIQAVAKPGAVVMAPVPGFVMYNVLSGINQVAFVGVDLRADFALDMPAMLDAIAQHAPALTFLAWPNNPTGNLWSLDEVEQIIKASSGLVVLDEAYTAFTEADALPLLDKYDNLLVMRTLSKIGLAGLRLGYLVARPEWINEFDKIRMPYNINVLTQASVSFALANYDKLMEQAAQLIAQRQILSTQLAELPGVEVYPSEANFLLLRCTAKNAGEVFADLKVKNILVKHLSAAHPLLENCLRVTVSTELENKAFVAALKEVL